MRDSLRNTWEIKRIKDIGFLKLGKMLMDKPNEGYSLKPYLKSRNIGWLKLNLDNVDEMYFNADEMSQLLLKPNDLLFSEGGEVGKTCIWDNSIKECYIQNSVHKLSLSSGYYPRYYLYHSFVLGQSGYYKSIVNLVSIMHLTYEKLSRVQVLVPPFSTQVRIANFLDKKIDSIDLRISTLDKKRDLYVRLKKSIINHAVTKGLDPDVKLKNSGVEWIGKIPEHWEVRRGKDSINILNGFPADSEKFSVGEGIPLIRIRDLDSETTDVSYTGEYPKIYEIETGDLLVGMDGDFNAAKWKGRLALLNQRVCKLSAKNYLSQNYLSYAISFPLKEINMQKVLTTVKHLSTFDLEQLSLPIPPLSEQQNIAAYLDEKCAKIDAAISNIERQIDAMKRLKRALIDEVVTGKREV